MATPDLPTKPDSTEGLSESQQNLAVRHLPLARQIARAAVRQGIAGASLDDLEGEAMLALCRVARSYDPARGVPFDAYARHRIRGQIRDFLRVQCGARRKEHRTEIPMSQLRCADATEMSVTRSTDQLCSAPAEDESLAMAISDIADQIQRVPAAATVHSEWPDELTLLQAVLRCRVAGCTMREVAMSCGVSKSYVSVLLADYQRRAIVAGVMPASGKRMSRRQRPRGLHPIPSDGS